MKEAWRTVLALGALFGAFLVAGWYMGDVIGGAMLLLRLTGVAR